MRQDRSVVPALRKLVTTSDNQLARFHALWTLEGLSALETQMARKLMKDENPQMRIQAIRASETLYKAGITSLADDYQRLTKDPNTEVDIQAMMTVNTLGVPDIKTIIGSAQATNSARGVQVVGNQILEQLEKQKKLTSKGFAAEQFKLYNQGAKIYKNVCASCHGDNGLGTLVNKPGGATMAPALSGSKRVEGHREFIVKVLLHGLKGPIEGETYPAQMIAWGTNKDEWIASVSSYVRNSMGNNAPFVNPEYVAMVRNATAEQKTNYIYNKLVASIPQELKPQSNWKVTASSSVSASPGIGSTADPSAAFTLSGWKTATAQKPGMWFKVNLKEPVELTEIQFESPSTADLQYRSPYSMFPRKYTVQVSMDGNVWQTIAKGQGKDKHTIINFKAVQARQVRIEVTSETDSPWGMRMLKLYVRK